MARYDTLQSSHLQQQVVPEPEVSEKHPVVGQRAWDISLVLRQLRAPASTRDVSAAASILCIQRMGDRRNFSRGVQNHRHFKKSTRFRRAVQHIDRFRRADGANEKFCVFSRCFRLTYRVSSASPEGYFVGRQHMTSFFSNSRGAPMIQRILNI